MGGSRSAKKKVSRRGGEESVEYERKMDRAEYIYVDGRIDDVPFTHACFHLITKLISVRTSNYSSVSLPPKCTVRCVREY